MLQSTSSRFSNVVSVLSPLPLFKYAVIAAIVLVGCGQQIAQASWVTLTGPGISTIGSVSIGASGTLSIVDGAQLNVTNYFALEASTSVFTIDVNNVCFLSICNGTGTLTNNGVVRISAGSNVAAGTYTPIYAGDWVGSGSYEAFGGTWNGITHKFTVDAVVSGNAGDLIETSSSRVQVSDAATGWNVGLSLAGNSGTDTAVVANAVSGGALAALQTKAGSGNTVKGAWEFGVFGGYNEGDPAYLSFEVGAGYSLNKFKLWHYSSGVWSQYSGGDVNYDGKYVNVTVTGFSGYALTAVPEPGVVALFVVGLVGVAFRMRKRK